MEKLENNQVNNLSLFLLSLENITRDLFSHNKMRLSLEHPSKIQSTSTLAMVSDPYHIVEINMKPYTFYTVEEIQFLDSFSSTLNNSIFFGVLSAKIFMTSIACINPFMAILIKNILVLEFCSVLILFNLKFPLQIRRLMTSLYNVVQQELVPNFYDVNLREHSAVADYKGNISEVGLKSYMFENAGGEINILFVLLIIWLLIIPKGGS